MAAKACLVVWAVILGCSWGIDYDIPSREEGIESLLEGKGGEGEEGGGGKKIDVGCDKWETDSLEGELKRARCARVKCLARHMRKRRQIREDYADE
eukprot:1360929-Amorphochlora_amoeboformis.AAC.1